MLVRNSMLHSRDLKHSTEYLGHQIVAVFSHIEITFDSAVFIQLP